jgi:transcriptional regulator with XRE-family HTH domain
MKKLHRSKKQKPEHVLARIKNELDLSQAEIPEGLGISLDTFKNILREKSKHWDKHARIVSQATGISVKSLLANNPKRPLLTSDGKRWTAQEYQPGIWARHLGDMVRERSRGRHTLQWFRLLMIKVARVLLAAYHEKKSPVAVMKLRKAISEIGKAFPAYTAKVPYKPKPGEPERLEVLPGRGTVLLTKICRSEIWDMDLQSVVNVIPSTSNEGVIKIYDAFLKEILTEENRQNKAGENDLITAEKRAREIHDASNGKPAKPPCHSRKSHPKRV